MPEQKLAGKVAIVAGGAKHLGGLISRTLAGPGAKIVVHYNSAATKDAADETVAEIRNAGAKSIPLRNWTTLPCARPTKERRSSSTRSRWRVSLESS